MVISSDTFCDWYPPNETTVNGFINPGLTLTYINWITMDSTELDLTEHGLIPSGTQTC